MKVRVQLYVAGKIFTEDVIVVNYADAKITAQARNPTAKIIGLNVVFD